MKSISRFVLCLSLSLLLPGCVPLVQVEQPVRTDWISLSAGGSLGQTFVARYDGLSGVAVYLRPGSAGSGQILLYLRASPQSGDDLASAALALERVSGPGFYRFQFPPLRTSRNRDLYLQMEIAGEGGVQAGAAPGGAYRSGALYQDGQPQEAQLSFRLVHDPARVLLGLAQEAFTWLGWLSAGFFLYILPGWGLLALLLPGWDRLGWGEKLGLSAGISLGLYPVLFLWTDRAGLHLGAIYAWLPALAGLAILVWKRWAARSRRREAAIVLTAAPPPGQPASAPQPPGENVPRFHSSRPAAARRAGLWPFRTGSPPSLTSRLPELSLLFALGLIFAARLWAIRSVDAPLWGDSYQHTMIAQLMLDHGGLFTSWEPYVPYRTLTVQFGFPTLVAVFSWLFRMASLPATLVVGQLLNGMAVLSIYPLAVRLAGGNRWAGCGAVLIAGLLSPMPGYYVNWGRYAQLAGQAILPAALWLLWHAAEEYPLGDGKAQAAALARTGILASLALCGMTLAYYRMPFYAAAFLLAWCLAWAIPRWRFDPHRWISLFASFGMIGALAGLLFLPWLLQLTGSYLASAVEGGMTIGSPVEGTLADFRAWQELGFYLPAYLLGFALAGFAWSLARRQWMVAAQVLWVALLAAYVAGRLVRLPGANMMQNFAVLIALYLPASLLGGWLAGWIADGLETRGGSLGRYVSAVVLSALALGGAWTLRAVAQPNTFALLTRPDLRALSWIQANTTSTANFLVQGFAIYGDTSAVGADGGWWIPLLAHRANTLPPQYALINEAPSEPGYTHRMVDLVNRLGPILLDTPQGLQLLCQHGITHIYNGQLQGLAGAGAVQLFSPVELQRQPALQLIYRQDRVAIYALDPQACEAIR